MVPISYFIYLTDICPVFHTSTERRAPFGAMRYTRAALYSAPCTLRLVLMPASGLGRRNVTSREEIWGEVPPLHSSTPVAAVRPQNLSTRFPFSSRNTFKHSGLLLKQPLLSYPVPKLPLNCRLAAPPSVSANMMYVERF